MDPNEVVSTIKIALLEEEKKFVGCHVVGWPHAEEKEFNRYLVTYTEGPNKEDTGYQTMIVQTVDDSTRESVIKDIEEALEVLV